MELSSNDSFLWTDASNESGDNQNKSIELMESSGIHSDEGGFGTCANYEQKARNANHENENETRKKRKTSKKRKCSEVAHANSDHSLENKQIKLEPDSDLDIKKKSKLDKDNHLHNGVLNPILYDEEYLNFRVKQEQSSFVQTKKKKKHKRSNSNTDDAYESDCTKQNKESYLHLLVKQEQQTSVVEPIIVKSKKRKKQFIVSSDIDNASDTKSVTLSETTVQDNSSAINEQTEYSVIEEKFFAEETVVDKPTKKKYKINKGIKNNSDDDNMSIYIKKNTGMSSEADNINNKSMSLGPSDFTSNNIVSSTIINNSAINLIDKQMNKTDDLFTRTQNLYITKISDRIRFEEDDILNQPVKSAKIDTFLKVNPHLKRCALETPKDNIITNDDEMWMLTWPHEIDLEKLRNSTFAFEGKCKIKINGQTYEGVLNEHIFTITLLIHQHKQAFITNVPVKDCISYHKRIPKVHIPNNNIMVNNQTNFTPLPETKCRHPLFGAHYKKAIKLPTAVTKRLQTAKEKYQETLFETIKKKRHKKDKYRSVDIKMEEDYECIKPETEPLKKKNKRKLEQDNKISLKKPKLVKHNTDSPVVWESEKAIEENLFNF